MVHNEIIGDVTVPDLAESIVAYRAFHYSRWNYQASSVSPNGFRHNHCEWSGEFHLTSMGAWDDREWVPNQPKKAKCACAALRLYRSAEQFVRPHTFEVTDEMILSFTCKSCPAVDGQCGLYAFKDPADMIQQYFDPLTVYAEIYMWGTVIEHEKGYRAEFAEIRALLTDPWGNDVDFEEIRNTYNLPVVEWPTIGES